MLSTPITTHEQPVIPQQSITATIDDEVVTFDYDDDYAALTNNHRWVHRDPFLAIKTYKTGSKYRVLIGGRGAKPNHKWLDELQAFIGATELANSLDSFPHYAESFNTIPYDSLDPVTVDWSKGRKPIDTFTGVISSISKPSSDDSPMVTVLAYTDDDYQPVKDPSNGSLAPPRKYHCHPDWLTPSNHTPHQLR
jgi:hypothetical protein